VGVDLDPYPDPVEPRLERPIGIRGASFTRKSVAVACYVALVRGGAAIGRAVKAVGVTPERPPVAPRMPYGASQESVRMAGSGFRQIPTRILFRPRE
jgi:hypothetical protein